jgi:hypothetical protein
LFDPFGLAKGVVLSTKEDAMETIELQLTTLQVEREELLALVPVREAEVEAAQLVMTDLAMGYAPASWLPMKSNLSAAVLRIAEARQCLEAAVPFLNDAAVNQADMRIDTARQRLIQAATCTASLAICRDTLAALGNALALDAPRLLELLIVADDCSDRAAMAAVDEFLGEADHEAHNMAPDFLLVAKLRGRAEAAAVAIVRKNKGVVGNFEHETQQLQALQRDAAATIKLLERYVADHYDALADRSTRPDVHAVRTLFTLSEFGPPQQTVPQQLRYAELALRTAREGIAKVTARGTSYTPAPGLTKIGLAMARMHGGALAEPDCH